MHNVLQALVDAFLLAAGSTEVGSAMYLPADSAWYVQHRATPKSPPERDLAAERAGNHLGEPALRASAEKGRI